jgi:hypothetical protein
VWRCSCWSRWPVTRLWLAGLALFLVFLRLWHMPPDPRRPVEMIRRLPASAAVAGVPLCAFASFFVTASAALPARVTTRQAAVSGAACLAWTIALDPLLTVTDEKINIRAFPAG